MCKQPEGQLHDPLSSVTHRPWTRRRSINIRDHAPRPKRKHYAIWLSHTTPPAVHRTGNVGDNENGRRCCVRAAVTTVNRHTAARIHSTAEAHAQLRRRARPRVDHYHGTLDQTTLWIIIGRQKEKKRKHSRSRAVTLNGYSSCRAPGADEQTTFMPYETVMSITLYVCAYTFCVFGCFVLLQIQQWAGKWTIHLQNYGNRAIPVRCNVVHHIRVCWYFISCYNRVNCFWHCHVFCIDNRISWTISVRHTHQAYVYASTYYAFL